MRRATDAKLPIEAERAIILDNIGKDVLEELMCRGEPRRMAPGEIMRILHEVYGNRRPIGQLEANFFAIIPKAASS